MLYALTLGLTLLACKGGGSDTGGLGGDTLVSDTSEVEATSPRACTDGKYHLHVVWQDERDGRSSIFYNRSADAGLSWMTGDVRLDDGEVGNAVNPVIACDGETVHVVWEDSRDGELENGNIYYTRTVDSGSTWAENVALDADPDGEAMSLSPAVAAASGAVYVSWFDARNGAYDVYVNGSTDAGVTWMADGTRVDTDEAGDAWSGSAVIAADGSGTVIVAWEDLRDDFSKIYVNRSTDHGESFAPSDTRLSGDGGVDSFAPRLLLTEGHAYVAWHDQVETDARDVYLSHSSNSGESWPTEATRMESNQPGFYDAYYPSIAANGPRLHAAWQDNRSNGYDIYYRRSEDGGVTWQEEEVRLDMDSPGEAQSVDVSLDVYADDMVVAVWRDLRNDDEGVGFNDLFYNFSEDGGDTWNDADLRINGNEPGSSYAIDPWFWRNNTDLLFVWADGRFGSSDIFFTSLKLGEESTWEPPEESSEEG